MDDNLLIEKLLRELPKSYFETHQWDPDSAVSNFTEYNVAEAAESHVLIPYDQQILDASIRFSNFLIDIPVSSLSPLNVSLDNIFFTLADDSGTHSDSEETQEYYNGGSQSGTIVQYPKERKDVDKESSTSVQSSRTTSAELKKKKKKKKKTSAEPQSQPDQVTHVVTIWRNGFTVNDSPLKTLDNSDDGNFIDIILRLESPREGSPEDSKIRVRLEEDFPESPQPITPFHGIGRTVAEPDYVSNEPPISSDSLTTTLPPSVDLVVDPAAPTTLIQFRLADGTRLVSRFNTHHTVRDVRGFIDSVTQGGSKNYQLLIMDSPPKPLPDDCDQTIQNAGISNSVLIQKF